MGMERLGVQFRNESGVTISGNTGSGPAGTASSRAPSAPPVIRTTMSDGANDYHILRPHDPDSNRLLTVLRDDVLCKRLPSDDIDGVDLLRTRLNGEEEGVSLVAIVAGKNLTNEFNRQAKGACLAELYTHPHTKEAHAHLTYLVTLNEGEGIGTFLIQSRIALLEEMARDKSVPLRTIFIEVCYDNEANKQKFCKLGARPGPAGYCRPDVQDPNVVVYDYTDMYYPVGGAYPDARDIADARTCYWHAQGVKNPDENEHFRSMMQAAQTWSGFAQTHNPAFEARLQDFRLRHGFATQAVEAKTSAEDPPAPRPKTPSAVGWTACQV